MHSRPAVVCMLWLFVCAYSTTGPFQVNAVESPGPAATPEPSFPVGFGVNRYPGNPVNVSDPNDYLFWQSLEVGNASAAVDIVNKNVASAVATGNPLQVTGYCMTAPPCMTKVQAHIKGASLIRTWASLWIACMLMAIWPDTFVDHLSQPGLAMSQVLNPFQSSCYRSLSDMQQKILVGVQVFLMETSMLTRRGQSTNSSMQQLLVNSYSSCQVPQTPQSRKPLLKKSTNKCTSAPFLATSSQN